MATAVFLDRDGVINRKPADGLYVHTPDELELLPGVARAMVALQAAGARLFVVTNQRGIARGVVTLDDLDGIHRELVAKLAEAGVWFSGIYFCPHELDECDCRKPGTGLFEQARTQHPWIEFQHSHMVGDSLSDMEAGWRLGMRLWLVGQDQRRADVAARVAARGIALAGQARSLLELTLHHGLISRVAEDAG